MTALFSLLLITFSLAKAATAFWHSSCISPIVAERANPIISPDIPYSHVQSIAGGNAFSPATTCTSTLFAICSSCTVRGDVSKACIPQLEYRCPSCSFQAVTQAAAATIYYLQPSTHSFKSNHTFQRFPSGLSMLAADSNERNASASNDSPSLAIFYVCLDREGPMKAEMKDFPSTSCLDGLRPQVFVPSRWDGVTLDCVDHSAHMGRPVAWDVDVGCPESHSGMSVRVFYEVGCKVGCLRYGGTRPFVWAQADPTGFGLLAYPLVGWDVGMLQRTVETCSNDGKRVEDFELTNDTLEGECLVMGQVEERVVGVLGVLLGFISGPWEAVSGLGCGTGAGNRSSVSGMKAIGGSSEVVSSRVAGTSSSGSMTVPSSDPGSPTMFSSTPNHTGILSSPTNSTHTEKSSSSLSSSSAAASSTKSSITISITKIHSVTIIKSSKSVPSAVISFNPSSASIISKHTHAGRCAGLRGQQLYGDDLRSRKH